MTEDVATRVAAGVALLDEHKPGWVGLIDLSTFAISGCNSCVLGQVYGEEHDSEYGFNGFGRGAGELDIEGREGEYGFDNIINDLYEYDQDDFPALQKEWVRVICVLRQKQEAVDQELVQA